MTKVVLPVSRVWAVFVMIFVACSSPDRSSSHPVVVCADPNNLPFSSRDGRGFELAIARVVADELKRPLSIHWRAQRRGQAREGLGAHRCDVLPGTVASSERSLNTRPYYRSTYVFVTHREGPRAARSVVSLDDPALRTLRIGVHMVGDDYTNTPPAHALASRGIVGNVVGYSLYGDYARPDPPLDLLAAVASREIDLAIVWGPFAGWAARHNKALVWRAVSPAIDVPFLPFVYDIAMGVRRSDAALRDSIDEILLARAPFVDSVLAAYAVPRVDRSPPAFVAHGQPAR